MSNVPEWAVKAAEELTAEMDWTQETKDYVKHRWAEIIDKHAPNFDALSEIAKNDPMMAAWAAKERRREDVRELVEAAREFYTTDGAQGGGRLRRALEPFK